MKRGTVSPAKRVTSLAIIIVIVGLAAAFFALRGETGPPVDIGSPAPDFTLGQLGNGYLTLSDLEGKVVMLNFWATWCGPCREEMPAMQNVYERYRDQGFEIVAINLQETEVAVKGFINQLGVNFPVVYDLTGEVFDTYLVRPLPTSYFIDSTGTIRFLYIGPMSEEDIEQRVQFLLRGPEEEF